MQYYIEDVRKVYELALPTLVYYAQEIHQRMQVPDSALAAPFPSAESVPAETVEKSLNRLIELANAEKQPEAVLIEPRSCGENFDLVRLVAIARILMPKTAVCVPAGSVPVNAETEALCFCAGANSVPSGEKLFSEIRVRTLDPDEHSRKMRGCKGDGSCGGQGCKGDGSCGHHHH